MSIREKKKELDKLRKIPILFVLITETHQYNTKLLVLSADSIDSILHNRIYIYTKYNRTRRASKYDTIRASFFISIWQINAIEIIASTIISKVFIYLPNKFIQRWKDRWPVWSSNPTLGNTGSNFPEAASYLGR